MVVCVSNASLFYDENSNIMSMGGISSSSLKFRFTLNTYHAEFSKKTAYAIYRLAKLATSNFSTRKLQHAILTPPDTRILPLPSY